MEAAADGGDRRRLDHWDDDGLDDGGRVVLPGPCDNGRCKSGGRCRGDDRPGDVVVVPADAVPVAVPGVAVSVVVVVDVDHVAAAAVVAVVVRVLRRGGDGARLPRARGVARRVVDIVDLFFFEKS